MKLSRKRVAVAAGVATAVVVLVVAVMAGQRYMNPDRITSPDSDDASSSAETTEAGENSPDDSSSDEPRQDTRRDLVEFESGEGGFAISYPEDWERIEPPPDSPVKLVATPDDRNSLQVSTADLGFSVGPEELPGMRQYTTSRIESSGENVDVVAGPSRVELDGLPGHVYIYTFVDPDTGETGVHSHYFLFDGDRMFTLVFQALPEERYEELAPLFDTIAESFRRQ